MSNLKDFYTLEKELSAMERLIEEAEATGSSEVEKLRNEFESECSKSLFKPTTLASGSACKAS